MVELTPAELEKHRSQVAEKYRDSKRLLELPASKLMIPVRRPTPILLALPNYDLVPQGLALAVNQHLKKRQNAKKKVPGLVQKVAPNPKSEEERIADLLKTELVGDFFNLVKEPLDIWILQQFALGRLEPVLPEELESFALGDLEDFAREFSTPPSLSLGDMAEGWPLAGSITGWALDRAAAVYRGFYRDWEQSNGVAKLAATFLKGARV